MQPRTRIVAMGDSTTAGTPAFQSPVEAPPRGAGDETSQYAYWLMQDAPRLGGTEPRRQRRAHRSDRGALRARRHRAGAGRRRPHRRRERRLPGPRRSATSPRQLRAMYDAALAAKIARRRRHHHSVQHRDARPEREDARDQRLDSPAGGGRPAHCVRRYACRRGRPGQSRPAGRARRTICTRRSTATAAWPKRSRRWSSRSLGR